MPNLVKETRHFGIAVKDMERSLKFYRDLLGLEIMREMDEAGGYIDNMLALKDVNVKTVKLSANNGVTLVELLQFNSHSGDEKNKQIYDIGPSHLAFTVNNLDESYEILKNAGIEFNSEPQLSPDGYAKVIFCKDPDGTLVELVEVLNET